MKIVNQTHLRTAWVVTSLRPPDLSATFVVKGAYSLRPNAAALPLEDPVSATGDAPIEGGPPESLYYPTDMAPIKLRTDLMLMGSCYPPGGRSATACPVEFRVGDFRKSLIVVGDRRSRRNLIGVEEATEPEPFSRMPLDYTRAYGGAGFPRNPLGRGARTAGSGPAMLPNIERPRDVGSRKNPPEEPAGFGPIPASWPQRWRNLGTFSAKYLAERWPWFPEDFDFGHFNAAPGDQQMAEALRGDEALEFVNLHPVVSPYASRLSGDRPQLFIRHGQGATLEDPAPGLTEVPLRIDTLWVDMDRELVVLVWRGHALVRSIKLKDVLELHVVGGSLAESPITTEEYLARLAREAAILKEVEDEERRQDEAERKNSAAEIAGMKAEVETLKLDFERQAAERVLEARATLTANGLDDKVLDKPVHVLLRQSDLEETLDHVRAHAPAEAAALEPLLAQLLAMQPPDLDVPAEDVPWTRERVVEHLATGGDLVDQDLSGLDLSGLCLDRARMSGAILKKATLAECSMIGADLSGANVSDADLTGSILAATACRNGDFTNASMDGVDLSRAELSGAIFAGASLKGARLDEAIGHGADFSSAKLSGATFRRSRMTQADFREADIANGDFTDADLPDVTFEGVQGTGVVMVRARVPGLRGSGAPDFSRSDFRGMIGPGSQWEGAILDDCHFEGAALQGSNFRGVSLRRARLVDADMSRASFEEAVVEDSDLSRTGLFRSSFERAVLRRSNFRQANLFETEFWNAVIEDVLWEGANLRRTKLAKS